MTAGEPPKRRLAAVTIGQAPRPDLLEALDGRLPGDVEIVELGALDGMAARDLPTPQPGGYPLTTRLADDSRVTLDEASLAPLVQAAIERAEAAEVGATLLLCAGGFTDVTSRAPLIRPFDAAVERLRLTAAQRIAVVVPDRGQVAGALSKWIAVGLAAQPVVGALADLDLRSTDGVDAIVLDYVGHPVADVAALRARCPRPVVDVGEAGAEAAAARFR